ncbi:uncharacterized protein LOC131669237 [Phymastichus coffea]|uniref:uncharacterized protein LOC131669237 n=1 Tax=Phymastichus coffea TaxID=108790 RepID=UPI00273C8495|nr:uncharacterized protein LOC131669237 [Phymastichus coffea]
MYKRKKKENYRNFVQSINFHTNPTYVWNTAKILKNKWIKATPSHTSENLQNDKKETALNKICPAWVPRDKDWMPCCNKNEFLETEFTFAELNLALESRSDKSSPGLDGIDYYTLKKLSLKYRLVLIDIFNEMYRTGDFPEDWKNTYIHFVKKPDGVNFRPIALTSAVCKLFETIIKNKMQWWIETQNILPKSQNGFRKGQSSTDNILNLTITVQKALREKKELYGVFLDISGAFDNVLSENLTQKLANIGCPYPLVKFIKFLTYERFVYSTLSEEIKHTYKGVPQGGVLSPLLYIIYVSDILKKVPKTISISQFADDIALYSKNKNSLQRTIKILDAELTAIGLELAPHKTVFINFNNQAINPGETEIVINKECKIKSSETVRFLGIIFDNKLSFKSQINNVVSKCNRALNILKYLCGTWWGADPATLITFYKSYVRSIIEYGCFVYYPMRKELYKKLDHIQNRAIRLAFGYRISTPISVLLGESKLPTIKQRAIYLCNMYLSKISSNQSLLVTQNINLYYQRILHKCKRKRKRIFETQLCILKNNTPSYYKTNAYGIYEHTYETITTSIPFNKCTGTEIKAAKNPAAKFHELIGSKNMIEIYTDGCKDRNNEYVGAACICPKLNFVIQRKMNPYTSIFTAECIAISDALDLVTNVPHKATMIFTDSLSVLESLQNCKIDIRTDPLIFEIKKKYNEISSKMNGKICVQLYWIPSHHGIPGNEQADIAAKSATNEHVWEEKNVSYISLKEHFKKTMNDNMEIIINKMGTEKGQNYFENFHSKLSRPWFERKNLPRDLIVTINRCRANHYNLLASLHRIGIADNPMCECQTSNQDLDHITWQCPFYDNQRCKLIEKLYSINMYLPMSTAIILSEPNITACKYLLDYFKECKLNV